MMIYAVTGLPGSGKTFRRTTDPALAGLPVVDVKRVYERRPAVSTKDAYKASFDLLYRHACDGQDVVFEGVLLPGMYGRKVLKTWAKKWGASITWVDVHEDPETCRQRIVDEGGDRMTVRLMLLEKLKGWSAGRRALNLTGQEADR